MEKIKLEYSKDWRNPADFPAVETDEVRVREDLQFLYSEIQTFVNTKLIPAMESLETPAIENLPTEDIVSGSNYKIPTSLAVSRLFASSGNLPAGGTAGQFLVKDSDDYGQATWQTHLIPKKMSDLEATDENGNAVNAQVLIEDVADKARTRYVELIASGTIGFSDTQSVSGEAVINLGDIAAYDRYLITIYSNPAGSTDSEGSIYIGAWNGKINSSYDSSSGGYVYSPDTTRLAKLSNIDTYGFRTETHIDLTLYPFRSYDEDKHTLVVFEQDRASVDPSEPDEGPRVLEVGTKHPQGGVFTEVVNDPSSITIFARNRYYSNSSDGERIVPYYVYGIRRGKKED
jgi:hypothetical protein